MKLSVRVRLTIVVAATMGLLAAGAAILAPSIVEDALVDDILVAEAEAQPLVFEDSLLAVGDFTFDEIFVGFGAGPLVDRLATSGDELEELIDLGGEDTLMVALGGKKFVKIDASGARDYFEADVTTIGQPVLTVFELVDLQLFADDLFGGLGPALDDLLAGGFLDDGQPGDASGDFSIEVLGDLFGEDVFAELEQLDLDGFDLDQVFGEDVFGDDVLGEVLADPSSGAPAGLLPSLFPETEMASGVRTVDGVDYIVFGDVSSVSNTVDRVGDVLWLAVPIVTLVAGLLAWVLASRALRPVRSITAQAATISGGTLDARVPVPGTGDEVADLATTVNEMLDRLERDDRRRRRFVSDASHELRSPVAVLRSEAEVALREPDGTDVEELAGAVAAESSRMATIIDDLLALARHDEGLPPPTTPIDLDDVVLSEAQRARRVPVDVSQVSAGRVPGRVDELTRLVGHLLDNAARHAESQVRVSLRTTGPAVVLVVDDDGPGVPLDQRAAIFDRFTRLDEARTRDEGGAGLGLAVVASIVERSGGRVDVGDSELGGAKFTLTWPPA